MYAIAVQNREQLEPVADLTPFVIVDGRYGIQVQNFLRRLRGEQYKIHYFVYLRYSECALTQQLILDRQRLHITPVLFGWGNGLPPNIARNVTHWLSANGHAGERRMIQCSDEERQCLQILELAADAVDNRELLRERYKELCLRYHPDKTRTENSTRFIEVRRAYEYLTTTSCSSN
jgi:hypothetical protein